MQIQDHKIGFDFWESKEALFRAFYGAFYQFIKDNNGEEDLKAHQIFDVEDFYQYADWNADGKDSCYAMGFSFHKYYLTPVDNADIQSQPTTTFIGYCYQNNMFKDFLNFLVTFFAWWRNDEGCTCFDPYNHADEFCHSSWAALVDTSKLFYLTAETVYFWQSFRVKYALDNIPGVILKDGNPMRVAGYEYTGMNGDMLTYKRKDFYNYWEKEEKTIKKVIVSDYKRVDPA